MSRVDVDFADSEVKYSAVIVSPPVVAGKTVRCDLLLADRNRPLKIRAIFYRDRRAELLRAGGGVEVSSVLERPQNFWASDFDYRSYLLRHGFAGTTFIYVTDWRGAPVSLEALSYLERVKIAALKFRNTLLSKLKAMGVGGQDYAVLAAMTLGERVAISDQLNDDYSVSGALHVLSLSGLHLSIIYAMLSFLFFRWRRSVVAQALVVCAVWAYVFVAGLPVSAVRSAVMLTVYSFVSLLNRDRMSLNTLAVAALVVLLSSPLSFYDVGFQMSFVSVLFIILLYRPLYSLMPRKAAEVPVVRWVWGMIVVSVAAQVGVAPLVAFYFGRFSCYFILTNFIVIPASTVILYGVVLMALVFFCTPSSPPLNIALTCAASSSLAPAGTPSLIPSNSPPSSVEVEPLVSIITPKPMSPSRVLKSLAAASSAFETLAMACSAVTIASPWSPSPMTASSSLNSVARAETSASAR